MDYLLTFIAGAIFGAGLVLVLNKFRRKDDPRGEDWWRNLE